MRTTAIALLMLLCATPLFAGEAEQANADKLLASMTEINQEVLGEHTLKLRMFGIQIGVVTFSLTAGEHEGQPCYVATNRVTGKFGEHTMKTEGVSYLTPSLTLLKSESKEWEGDKLTKHSTYTLKDGAYVVKLINTEHKNKDMRDRTLTVKPEPRLLLAAAENVITLFVSREAGTKYEFKGWDSDAGKVYALNVEVGEAAEVGKAKAVPVIVNGKNFKVDELGNAEEEDFTSTTWFDGKSMVKVELPDAISFDNLEDPKLTRLTREDFTKGTSARAVAAGFFYAISKKDKELLEATMDTGKFARIALDYEDSTKGMADEQKDELAEMIKDTIAENILQGTGNDDQTETEKKRNEGVIDLLMHEENLEHFEFEGRNCVRFKGEIGKAMGYLLFIVEKGADDKWKVVWILSGDEAKEVGERHDAGK